MMTGPQAFCREERKRRQRVSIIAPIAAIWLLAAATQVFAAESNQRQHQISFKKGAGCVEIFLKSQKITTYVYEDNKTSLVLRISQRVGRQPWCVGDGGAGHSRTNSHIISGS